MEVIPTGAALGAEVRCGDLRSGNKKRESAKHGANCTKQCLKKQS